MLGKVKLGATRKWKLFWLCIIICMWVDASEGSVSESICYVNAANKAVMHQHALSNNTCRLQRRSALLRSMVYHAMNDNPARIEYIQAQANIH